MRAGEKIKTVRISIVGFGHVGSGVAEVVMRKHDEILRKHGLDLRIVGIADLKGAIIDEGGLSRDEIARFGAGGALLDMSSLELIREI